MRKRPCLLFACIFLTGIVFQRYDWKLLWFVPLFFEVLEFVFVLNTYLQKNVQNQSIESGSPYNLRSHKEKRFQYLKIIAGRSILLLSAFFLGISNTKTQEEFRNTYMSKIEDNKEIVVYGEILTTEETEYGSRLILTDCYISLNETAVPCNKVMVYVSSDQYHVGQIYQVKGKLNLFKQARNEGNFDAVVFYQSQKIDFSVSASECILLGYKNNVLREWILAFRERLSSVYKNSLEEKAAGFYMGMMLGDKSLLSEETKDLFAVGGISHILAISGLHISMIGRGFYTQLRKRRISFLIAGLLASFVLLAYCYMVGSGMSAVRAVGMMVLFFLSQTIGRSYDMLNSLGAMMIYLLWDNPFLVEYSGFQFSVAALMGVGVVGKILSQTNERSDEDTLHVQKTPDNQKNEIPLRNASYMQKKTEHQAYERPAEGEEDRKSKWNFVENDIHKIQKHWSSNLWMSIGITLATLPIVSVCYFEIPLYSPLVNSLVLPFLTPIFALAIFGGLSGCILPAIGKFLLIPCGWLYEFYEFVCEFVARLPFGSVITGKPKLEVVVLYYVVLFVGCLIIKRITNSMEENVQKKKMLENDRAMKKLNVEELSKTNKMVTLFKNIKRCHVSCILMGFCKLFLLNICFFIIAYPKPIQSEIVFLDVGQGDGIFIASADGTTCFIDGGSSDVKAVGEYRILPFLKAHGVRRIDYWFVTHADTDHISGVMEVMETGYEISHLVVSDKMPEDEKRDHLLALANEQGISVIQMKVGEYIQTISSISSVDNMMASKEGMRITCLYPFEQGKDKNEQSIVLLVEFFDGAGACIYKAFFSGDISTKGEMELIKQGVLADVDLYKAAHHGSKYSNSKAFLNAIQPEVCVISCGEGNSYGHPHAEAIENMESIGAEVLYTMESGQITFEIGETIQIKFWLKEIPP